MQPQLFATLGNGDSSALRSTLIVGAVNVAATIVAIVLVDRVGEFPIQTFDTVWVAASSVLPYCPASPRGNALSNE